MKKNIGKKDRFYLPFLKEIISEIRKTQYKATKIANQYLVQLYWQIGEKIATQQKSKDWNENTVLWLSSDLKKEFPKVRGFSPRNLWKMRQFYISYINDKRLNDLIKQISWTHNLVIVSKCQDPLEKEFYIRMTIRNGWTKNVLLHHIENQTYRKTITNQTNFEKTLPKSLVSQAQLAVKDDYLFDFLEIGDEHSERELEKCLVRNVESFLLEIGEMYTFVRSQYRIEINDKEYFIDILLYHRRLRCLIAIELKVVEFIPEHVGKMQFYLAILDDKVKLEDEQPSIGIILCKSKDKTIVEYALKDTDRPIGVASYSIFSSPPKELEHELPTPEQIVKLLNKVDISQQQVDVDVFKTTEEKVHTLSKSLKKVVEYTKKNGRIGNKGVQVVSGVKKKQATNILSELVKKQILIKKGAGRGTYYIYNDDQFSL